MDEKTLQDLAVKSLENAKELLEEAKLLYIKKHFPRAVFLSQIGGEELGKHMMCVSGYVNILLNKFDEKKFKKRFLGHKEKSANVVLGEHLLLNVDQTKSIDEECGLFEKTKMGSLYVDVDKNTAHKPSEVINKKATKTLLGLFEQQVKHFEKQLHLLKELFAKKISLPANFIEHLKEAHRLIEARKK